MEYLSVQDRLLFLEEYSSLAQPSLDAVLSWFGLQSMLGITPREMLAITFNPTRYPDHQQGDLTRASQKPTGGSTLSGIWVTKTSAAFVPYSWRP
jgi:hypothetical protein